MNKSSLASIAVACTLPVANALAQSQGVYSVQWLKEGLSVILFFDAQQTKSPSDRANPSREQFTTFYQTTFWLNGFIVGFNASCMLEESNNSLNFPPEEWLDPRKIAPSLLQYIQNNSDLVDDAMPARVLMASWYYANHPRSTNRDKSAARLMLENE